jgi:hypothetical protein
MTQEEKELLIKDLCGRLPYGLIIKCNDGFRQSKEKLVSIDVGNELINYDWLLTDIKPYLRSLSSMTESERKEFDNLSKFDEDVWMGNHKVGFPKNVRIMSKCVDWLNKNMFDYRGLIPKGLANEAPEGMYNN